MQPHSDKWLPGRSQVASSDSPDFQSLVTKIIALPDRHSGDVQSWVHHRCRKDDLVIGFDVVADCGDQPLKILAPLLGHSFILDIVEE